MKSNHYVGALAILNALVICFSGTPLRAGESKGGAPQTGGRASSHMSSNGVENTNAQWSADPDHGWIRADERHDLHEKRESDGNRGKSKGRGAKGKSVPKNQERELGHQSY